MEYFKDFLEERGHPLEPGENTELLIKKSKTECYDKYDDYGRNITEQERRQELEPWIRVIYRKKSGKS